MDIMDLRAPNPGDVIVLKPTAAPDTWGYRYEPPPTSPDGNVLFGRTRCCERLITVAGALVTDAADAVAAGRFPLIGGCCERPFATHGHKPIELPPYSGEHATCRKCGSKAVETKFTTKNTDSATRYGIPRPGYPDEWLHRRCVVCGAEWDEATKPQAAGTEQVIRHITEAIAVTGEDATDWQRGYRA